MKYRRYSAVFAARRRICYCPRSAPKPSHPPVKIALATNRERVEIAPPLRQSKLLAASVAPHSITPRPAAWSGQPKWKFVQSEPVHHASPRIAALPKNQSTTNSLPPLPESPSAHPNQSPAKLCPLQS